MNEDERKEHIKTLIIAQHDGICSLMNINGCLELIEKELKAEQKDLGNVLRRVDWAKSSIKRLSGFIQSLYPVEKFLKSLPSDLSPRT